MSLQQWWVDARKRLVGLYDEREASNIVQWLLEDSLKLNRTTFQLRLQKPLSEHEQLLLNHQLRRLEQGEPLQYVTELAVFHGHQFRVGPEVLIPRPETEELIDLILKTLPPTLFYKVLDIGTGSGCIPISVQLARPNWNVYAVDISPEALAVAKWNAAGLGASVHFVQGDFLNEALWKIWVKPDVLVSNPPYIAQEEAAKMTKQVLEHEPRIALFPIGEDAMIFYKKLADYAVQVNPKYVFLELNPNFAYEVAHMFQDAGYAVEIVQDMQGKDRMLSGYLLNP
ncbi:peptide chain release factor N(5)-glutamine methyltransferase [soil metagenome]